MAQRIILDTDIGDDIDDAYALSLILKSPELELVGVTTVFANAPARTRQAQTILKIVKRGDVPVATGCGATLSPRLNVAGEQVHAGIPFQMPAFRYMTGARPCQDSSALPASKLPKPDPRHAVDFLIETLLAGRGDIIPVTIGAMTNLAMALVKEPKIRLKIPRIVSMAACFDRQYSEWNIRCDPVAAALVFDSGIPMTVIGLDVTTKCKFNDADLARLHAGKSPLSKNLSAATRAWNPKGYPCLHDPLAVETLLDPDIVTLRRGRVRVELAGAETYGYTLFTPDDKGPHAIGVAVKSRAALDLWLERVLT
jgi:purine nucleosidase/pyrimidine-specific ribonucleoside hydrolase